MRRDGPPTTAAADATPARDHDTDRARDAGPRDGRARDRDPDDRDPDDRDPDDRAHGNRAGDAGPDERSRDDGDRGGRTHGDRQRADRWRRSPWPAVLLAALVAMAGAALGIPGPATYGAVTTADEPQYLLSALSLAEDGDLDIADELDAERWREFHAAPLPQQTRPLPGGVRISPHDPLLPLVMAPAVGAVGWQGGQGTLVVVAGLLAALLVWTAVRRLDASPTTAGVVVAGMAGSVPLAPYGSQVYPELPAALAVAAGLALLLREDLRRRDVVGLALVVVALPWLAVKYAPVAMVLAVATGLALARSRRWRSLACLLGALGVAGIVYLGVHRAIWTGWTVYASADHFVDSGELGVMGFSPDYVTRGVRVTALLVERRFGIATWQPAWLALLPALGAWLRRPRHGRWTVVGVLLAGWLTATFVALTMAGWWFPGRQVVVVLPAAVLLVAAWADRSAARRRVLGVVSLLGVASWAWLAVEAALGRLTLVVDFHDTTNPLVRGWRVVLPDFQEPTDATWPLHVLWVVVLLVAVWWGWRRAAHDDAPGGAGASSSRAAHHVSV